jgi:flagellar biosynthesis protein FliQ
MLISLVITTFVSIIVFAFAVWFVDSKISQILAYVPAIIALLLSPLLGDYMDKSILNIIRSIASGFAFGLLVNQPKIKEYVKMKFGKG